MGDRIKEMLELDRLGRVIEKHDQKKMNTLLIILAIFASAAVCLFFLYRYFTPDYIDEYDDEYDDDFDDDFFDEED